MELKEVVSIKVASGWSFKAGADAVAHTSLHIVRNSFADYPTNNDTFMTIYTQTHTHAAPPSHSLSRQSVTLTAAESTHRSGGYYHTLAYISIRRLVNRADGSH